MAIQPFTLPTYQQLLQASLQDFKAISDSYGYDISIEPGTEIYLRYAGQAGQRAVFYQLVSSLINSQMIDTASGINLDRVANAFGIYRRGDVQSSGFVKLIASVAQNINAGITLTGPNSLQYEVSTSGIYIPNANIPINSVDSGSQTNLSIGTILSWGSVQPNMQSTCQVSISVTGGADAEDDNTLRNRLYLALQSPAQMGNDQDVTTIAGSVDGTVQQAYVYSNFNGAGTQLIVLSGYQTTSYVGRDIAHLSSDGYVKPYGINQLQPGLIVQLDGYGPYNQYSLSQNNFGQNLSNDTFAIYGQISGAVANPFATVVTTVNNTPSSVAAVLTLPYPVGAGTNGFGNGWLDFTPWPNPDGYYVADGYCKVVSIQGSGTTVGGQTGFGITVKAPSSGLVHTNPPFTSALTYNNNTPIPGTTHIQWTNRSDDQDTGWTVVTATVIGAHDNGNDTWALSLDTPLTFASGSVDFYGNTGVAVGDFIYPASTNGQTYLNNMMTNYALLSPGEVTSSQGLLTLGASRYPSSNAQFPNTLGSQVERYLEVNNNEVYNCTIDPRSAYNTAFNAPATNAPPNIFVPNQIGFYTEEIYGFGKP